MAQGVFTAPRVVRLVAIAALASAWPSASRAQAAAAVEPQFTRAQAEALLAETQGADLFEIVALEDDHIGLRHRASGMVCRFAPDFENGINVLRPGQDNSDVSCLSGPWPSTMSAATRYVHPRAFIASMEETFRREHANSQPFAPSSQFWPAPARDAVYLHLVSQSASGERSVIHAVSVRRGRWTIVSRMTYDASGALPIMAAELAAAAHFQALLSDLEN